ncbi:MAG: T9SS type A sorting domain-containing protein [Bacteroidia bacterium]
MKKQFTFIRTFAACSFMLFANLSNAQWVTVGPLAGPGINTVFDLQSFNSDLYAAGPTANGAKAVSKWNGTVWSQVARAHPQFNQYSLGINSLSVYNNQIIAGGSCDSIGGVFVSGSDVVTYNGLTWAKLGINPPSIQQVNCFAIYNNELYVGGKGINKWDGTNWTSISSSSGTGGYVHSMAVYNNELYAGGDFTKIGGINMTTGKGFGKWNGTTWSVLPGLTDSMIVSTFHVNGGNVASMMPFNGELCVIGNMQWAGSLTGLHGAAKWNGTVWSDMHGGVKGNGALNSNCLTTDGSNLYLVGALQRVNVAFTNDSINQAARWDGTTWYPMLGTSSSYAFLSVENYNNEIHSAYQAMVKWTGSTSTGIKQEEKNNDLLAYPNPVKDIFYLKNITEKALVQIFNSNGELVQTSMIEAGKESKFDCGSFTPGLYIIRVKGEDFMKSARFIKE